MPHSVLSKLPWQRLLLYSLGMGLLVLLGIALGKLLYSSPADVLLSDNNSPNTTLLEEQGPAVVTIQNNLNAPFSYLWPHADYQRIGTGFIVDESGLILTNRQSVPDSELDYTVFLSDGTSHRVQQIDIDPTYDLVILQIDAVDLPVVTLAENTPTRPGQLVYSIGNRWQGNAAWLEQGQLTAVHRQGLITYRERDPNIPREGSTPATYRTRYQVFHDILLSNLAHHYGNSGGPLFNDTGQVIGMLYTQSSETGQGFSLPIEDIRHTLDSFARHGRIVQPDIGVDSYLLGARYELILEEWVDGAMINAFCVNAPALESGLASHDRITSVEGKPVAIGQSLQRRLQLYAPGDEVEIEYITPRGEFKNTTVTVQERALLRPLADVSCLDALLPTN